MASVLISSLPNITSNNYTQNDLLVMVGYSGNPAGVTYHTPLTSFTQYVSAHTGSVTGASYSNGTLTLQTPIGNVVATGLSDIYVTGGTYNVLNDTVTFRNTSGGTFTVTGFSGVTLPAGVNEDVQFNNNGSFGAASLKYRASNSSTWNRGANNISSNTVFGEDAMRNTTGSGNTVYGYQAYYTSGSTGGYNSAFGYQSLYSNSGGSYNSSFGYKSQYTSTNTTGNTSIGSFSLYSNQTGNDNVAIGYGSLSGLTSGSRNVAVGYQSSFNLTTANDIVSVGSEALYSNISSNYHIAIGYQSLRSLTGSSNPTISIGHQALKNFNPTNNYQNLGVGTASLFTVTNFASGNTAVGLNTLYYLPNNSYDNTAFGSYAGKNITTPVTGNTIFGTNAGQYLSGSSNTLIGLNAGVQLIGNNNVFIHNPNNTITSGNNNTIVGIQTCTNGLFTDGTIAFGSGIFNNPLSGSSNIGFGYNTLKYLTTGSNNIGFGTTIASNSTSTGLTNNILVGRNIFSNANFIFNSSGNTIIGIDSFVSATGETNTSLGYQTGYYLTGGSQNTFIGYRAGYTTTGNSNVTLIGYNANLPSSGSSNNNAIVLGDLNVTSLRCNVTSITSLSDIRDKTDIQTIPVGIDFINEINPVTFTWNRRDGSMNGEKSSGFIAQELKEVEDKYGMNEWLNLVNSDDPNRIEATPGNLLPVLVKAIQDLSKEQKELEEILKGLENK